MFSAVYLVNVSDIATCIKVFKKDFLYHTSFVSDGFEIEVEMFAKAFKKSKNSQSSLFLMKLEAINREKRLKR